MILGIDIVEIVYFDIFEILTNEKFSEHLKIKRIATNYTSCSEIQYFDCKHHWTFSFIGIVLLETSSFIQLIIQSLESIKKKEGKKFVHDSTTKFFILVMVSNRVSITYNAIWFCQKKRKHSFLIVFALFILNISIKFFI